MKLKPGGPKRLLVPRRTDEPSRRRAIRAVAAAEVEVAKALAAAGLTRPVTRADCAEGLRPCPFVSCRHHLYLDVKPATGSIRLCFPDLEVGELKASCALDIAEEHGRSLQSVGAAMGVTQERVRQVEERALGRIRVALALGEP